MKSLLSAFSIVVLSATTNATEEKSFRITLAGSVQNPEHVDVKPSDKLSNVVQKAGGIDSFGVKYRFYVVRIIDLNRTERAESPESPPNQKEIKMVSIRRDSDPTMAELKIISGDILVFDRKHVYGK
jgi:hypothetical protein